MNVIFGGICLVGIVGTYVMVFALCRMAAIGDAMMERHIAYLREQDQPIKSDNQIGG